MRITNEEYKKLYQKASPRSPMLKDIVLAFLIGGAICTVGQAIKEYFISLGLDEKAVSSALSITMIFLGVLLTDLRIYPKIAKYAGAGTIVPITGFANSIASPAVEYKTEGLVLGTCVKMFTIAGPVLVCGLSASVVYGLIYYIMS
ncbi:MAG TPA: stage V sporulation protein AC [Firmicutes bacterium]|nr:stage V sporulation protein AC [Bacillota bacterium]